MKRTSGLGVRAKTSLGEEISEFVIRERGDGNETLSLLHDEELIQVVTSKRDEFGNITIEKHMITKNVEAFSHYRYDWLDTTKFLWWGLLTFGILFLMSGVLFGWGINLGTLLFLFGLFFTLLQAADPEYIVFETSSSSHRFLVYRFGSNLQLTNISMDLIDDMMQEYLRTGKLDTSVLDSEAQKIENQRILLPVSNISVTTQPTVAPSAPPPMAPPTVAPSAPPPMVAPPQTNSEFSEIPPPPPVDFSNIPMPPQINELEAVSEEDKNELLDALK